MKTDVLIIGGGAAGLLCAIEAGKRGRRVLILEQADRIGKKILVSGGGRCNFTHRSATPNHYLSANPSFCISALSRYTPEDFITLVEKHGIRYTEKNPGQLFCDQRSPAILALLEEECRAAKVEIRCRCRTLRIEKPSHFRVETDQGSWEAETVVIAGGGLSLPKLGASDFGYRIAEQFGLRLTELRPALVPLIFHPDDQKHFSTLSGISLPATVQCDGAEFHENILFTHRGLSGPAILQISSYWREGHSIWINLFPNADAKELLFQQAKSKLKFANWMSLHFPHRFALKWSELFADVKPLNQYSPKELEALAHRLQHWEIRPEGTEGYRKAEVTLGGVDTRDLSPKTMEARTVPGLYFIGEVTDVTGHLGGYNFQWAWSSGYAAGQAV